MEDQSRPHEIFVTNPAELMQNIGRYVNITLENKEVLKGTVYAIDPVSQSIILINNENEGDISLKIVMKHSTTLMEIIPEVPVDQQNILQKDIFKSDSTVIKNKSKESVKQWLLKNLIPVEESGEKLIVDSLEIYPPYGVDQCYCSNSIVLSRIQNLLNQMPVEGS